MSKFVRRRSVKGISALESLMFTLAGVCEVRFVENVQRARGLGANFRMYINFNRAARLQNSVRLSGLLERDRVACAAKEFPATSALTRSCAR